MGLSSIEIVEKVNSGTIEPGWYSGLVNKVYHMIRGLSSTAVKYGLESMAHMHVYLNKPSDDTVASVGTYAHTLVLEPELAERTYQMKLNGNTKEGKAQKAEAEAKGITLIRPGDMKESQRIAAATLGDKDVKAALDRCEKEVSGFAYIPGTQHVVKIRPDAIDREKKRIYDLKTVSRGSNRFQIGSIANRQGWYHQAAWYQWVAKQITGDDYEIWHIYADDVSPKMRRIPEAVLERCFNEDIAPLLPKYIKAVETNEWPGHDNSKEEEAYVPGWVWSESDYETEGE